MGMKFNEIKYRRRDLSRILLEKCKLSFSSSSSSFSSFSFFHEEKRFHDEVETRFLPFRDGRERREFCRWRPSSPPPMVTRAQHVCCRCTPTRSNVSEGCTRVQSATSLASDIPDSTVPRSPINGSKIFASVITPRIFPRRDGISDRGGVPRGGNSRGTPFLGLLNLRGSFLQFSEDTVSPGETARDANEVTVEFSSLRFSNCRCSKQNHWERGILIEIDKKISDPSRWKIYAEYLSKYSICRDSIGIAKRVGEISLRSASN